VAVTRELAQLIEGKTVKLANYTDFKWAVWLRGGQGGGGGAANWGDARGWLWSH
jgi:hypothetical protein